MLVGAIHTITKAPLSERTAPAYEQPDDNMSGALDRLGNLTEAAAHSRKAFAEERLKQLREQMNKLMLFDMAPGVQAGRSAQFARELKAAAEDFAGAFEALAALPKPPANGLSLAQQAYLDLDDGPQPAQPSRTQADIETMDSFMSAAQQLTAMAESANSRIDRRDSASALAGEAYGTASEVIEMMGRLKSASAPRAFYW
jgi:hypothetical protein